ncbi:MAG: DUF736 domain-containing protein [Pseudolabrys sp.]
MRIGTFIYDEATDSFSGDISTLHFQFSPVEIVPNEKRSEKGPDYRITSDTAHGHVELGKAWKCTSDQGRAYVSVSLDSPLLNAPLKAAIFTEDDGSKASLVWNRLKAKTEATADPKPKAKTAAKKAA